MHKSANLVESTIATVEGNLESDISTVVEACHVGFREVDAEVGQAFSCRLEELGHQLVIPVRIIEIAERSGIGLGRYKHTD